MEDKGFGDHLTGARVVLDSRGSHRDGGVGHGMKSLSLVSSGKPFYERYWNERLDALEALFQTDPIPEKEEP